MLDTKVFVMIENTNKKRNTISTISNVLIWTAIIIATTQSQYYFLVVLRQHELKLDWKLRENAERFGVSQHNKVKERRHVIENKRISWWK